MPQPRLNLQLLIVRDAIPVTSHRAEKVVDPHKDMLNLHTDTNRDKPCR